MDEKSREKSEAKGHWREFSDARGIESQYRQDQANADRELAEATAGPDDSDHVAPNDTELKNPHGELQSPSTMAATPPGAPPSNKAAERADGVVRYSPGKG